MKRRGNGFSLVEVILCVVILSITVPASMLVLSGMTRQSLYAEEVTLAVDLGSGLLEEIRARAFDELLTAPGAAAYTVPPSGWSPIGLDGEIPGNKTSFDDVDDFNGYAAAIPGHPGFTWSVSVAYVDPSDLNTPVGTSRDYKRVAVTVSNPSFNAITLVTLIGPFS